jgi:integrase
VSTSFLSTLDFLPILKQLLRRLKIGNILDKTIFIPKGVAKNRKGEHVLMAPALEKLVVEYKLRSYPKEHYIFGNKGEPSPTMFGINYFYKSHRKLLKVLDLVNEEYDLYGYKHTAVINIFNNGADIKDIQKQCRHSTAAQTDQYLKHLGLFRNDNLINNFPDF